MNARWTKPFYGVQHLGSFSTTKRWVTVLDYESFALLHKWFPGCGFNPTEEKFESVSAAQAAGEKYLAEVLS